MNLKTQAVVTMLYDHLLTHPFYDTTVRIMLAIPQDEDVDDNIDYWETMTKLIDESLVALIVHNHPQTPGETH